MKKGNHTAALIRNLVLQEIVPIPHAIAGRNIIKYDKEKDNFSWFVKLDSGEKSEVLSNISPDFLDNLEHMISGALEEVHGT